jgi:hypothetical protein
MHTPTLTETLDAMRADLASTYAHGSLADLNELYFDWIGLSCVDEENEGIGELTFEQVHAILVSFLETY